MKGHTNRTRIKECRRSLHTTNRGCKIHLRYSKVMINTKIVEFLLRLTKVWRCNKIGTNSAQNSSRHMVEGLPVHFRAISHRNMASNKTQTWKKRMWAADLWIIWIRFRKPLTRLFKRSWRVIRGSYRPIIIVWAIYTLSLLKTVNVKNTFQICYTNPRRNINYLLTRVIPKSRQHPLQVHICTKLVAVNIQPPQANQNPHTNQLLKRIHNHLPGPFLASHNKTLRQVKQDKSLPKSDSQLPSPMSQYLIHPTSGTRPWYQSLSVETLQWAPKRRVWPTPSTNRFHQKDIPVREHP